MSSPQVKAVHIINKSPNFDVFILLRLPNGMDIPFMNAGATSSTLPSKNLVLDLTTAGCLKEGDTFIVGVAVYYTGETVRNDTPLSYAENSAVEALYTVDGPSTAPELHYEGTRPYDPSLTPSGVTDSSAST